MVLSVYGSLHRCNHGINSSAVLGNLSLCNRCVLLHICLLDYSEGSSTFKDAVSYSLFSWLHCGRRHLQLFNNNKKPSKGLIGLFLVVSSRGDKMGSDGGDVGEWVAGKDLWYRSGGKVRDCSPKRTEHERDWRGKRFEVMGRHQQDSCPLHQ